MTGNGVLEDTTAADVVEGRCCGLCYDDLIEIRIESSIEAAACPVHGIRWREDHGYVRGRQSDAFARSSLDPRDDLPELDLPELTEEQRANRERDALLFRWLQRVRRALRGD